MMLIENVQVIRTSVSACHTQIANSGSLFALPLTRTSIGIWSLQHLGYKPLELVGHRKCITALSFNHSSHPQYLCSAGEDYIIVWNIDQARASYEADRQIKGKVISQAVGQVEHVSYSCDDSFVAVCADRFIYILHSQEEKLEATLEGHDSNVTCAQFCPHFTSTLVSISEDRTFKIWNIEDGCLVYQSCIVSASPFISLTMHPLLEQFAVGSTDGQVRIYDLSDGKGFRQLHHIDAVKLIKKHGEIQVELEKPISGPKTISSRKTWQQNGDRLPSPEEVQSAEVGCSILSLHYAVNNEKSKSETIEQKLSFLQTDDTVVNELLDSSPALFIGTTGSLLQLDAKSLEVSGYTDLSQPIRCSDTDSIDSAEVCICAAGNMNISKSFKMHQTWCIIGSLFQNTFHILSIDNLMQERRVDELTASESTAQPEISVLSSIPLNKDSPLRAELVPKTKEAKPAKKLSSLSTRRPSLPGSLDKKGKIASDQPVTYHSKVKSSGYSSESPKKLMFQPHLNVRKQKPTTQKPNRSMSLNGCKSLMKEYPMDGVAPTVLNSKIDVDISPTAINSMHFSGDGQYFACALANKSSVLFKHPLREQSKAVALSGHKDAVCSINWSKENCWLISGSDDRSAAIWSPEQVDPVIVLDKSFSNFDKDDKENSPFTKAIKHAQFYYMDKFILLTCGNSFSLYKYHLDPVKSDIKRYVSSSRYKLVKKFQMDNMQSISAFTAVNSFYSYIVLIAGSNKSIDVYDMNSGKSVLLLEDIHTKPVHQIAQNEGSAFVSHASNAYDLFVTSSAGDCIKMWDLRTRRCVRRFEGHKNRVYPCGLSISPCGRFIATGAEDKSAYIYDVRSGDYLHKLTGHTDVVADVKFHPLYPKLLTASVDGKLRLFAQK
ncbi:WD repeat-containing protein 27-like [Tubulanus polymorphus]|uniref:WD repeat-containing protein 27-like n=1 Tax=Tubulanus polymorphus TaxID=672921 RepID=UPI003DA55107